MPTILTIEELRREFWNLKDIHAQMKLEDAFRVQMNRAYCERIDKAGAHEAWADAVEHYPQTKEN